MTEELDESQQEPSLEDLINEKFIEDWTIQQLINVITDRTELKMTEIAEKINVEYPTLHKWVSKGTNPASNAAKAKVKRDLIKVIIEYNNKLHEDSIKYLTNIPELKFDLNHPLVSIPLNEDGNVQLYTDTPVATGTILERDGKNFLIACRNTIPSILSSEGFINIIDDKLGSKLKGGLWIAITKQKFFKHLYAGRYHYIIDKNHTGILRRIRISANNSMTLISDLKEDDNIIISLDDVVAVFTVDWFFTKEHPINE
jgi:hypothetical protein